MCARVSVIVPTYNERENIAELIKRIHNVLKKDYEIVVVDDNSPDGTAEIVTELSKEYPIKLIVRENKAGLASAILEGFKNSDGEIIGVIDADLQHPPEMIEKLVEEIKKGNDIAIASRYVDGGVEKWPLTRKIISKGAIYLAKPILNGVEDPMSGFFFLKRSVIEGIEFNPKGFKLLLEILVKGKYNSISEIPYVFSDRMYGDSKMGKNEIMNYLRLLWRLYRYKLFKPTR